MKRLAALTGWFTVLYGSGGLIAWWVRDALPTAGELSDLTLFVRSLPVAEPATTAALLVAGSALLLARSTDPSGRALPPMRGPRFAAALLFAGALAAVAVSSTAIPGRVPLRPTTAVTLGWLGASLISINLRRIRVGQLVAMGTSAVALAALLAHLYGVGLPEQPAAAVPAVTAATLFALALAVFALRPAHGYVGIVLGQTPGGGLARRLLPGAAAIPLVLGSLGAIGVRGNLSWALAIAVVATMVGLCVLVLRNASVLSALEEARLGAVRDLRTERGAADDLRRLDETKTRFVAVVAHDLRSPVVAIRNYAELLLGGWDAMTDDRKRELVATVGTTAESMSTFVSDVLDVARLQRGEMPLERKPFDMVALVRRSAADTEAAHGRPCPVDAPPDAPEAVGDERQQWRVLTNLLSNAVKFSPPGSPVELSVTVLEYFIEVAVRDHGPGITAEHLPMLFEPFSRPPGQTQPGAGLGLFICKGLVEAQWGKLDVDSAPGEGTVFRWTVPSVSMRSHGVPAT